MTRGMLFTTLTPAWMWGKALCQLIGEWSVMFFVKGLSGALGRRTAVLNVNVS